MTRKFEWLEVMRGFAALWVVLHHADLSVAHFFASQELRPLFLSNGFLGVDFFFLLSGFIIAFSSNKLLNTGRGIADYAKLRLIRIYVPYLPIGLAMYFAYLILPGLSEGDRSPGFFTSFFLLPTNSPPALSVAWTLVHEIIFYALFSIIFFSKKLLLIIFTLWTCLIAVLYFNQAYLTKAAIYIFSPLNLNFICGVCLFYLLRKGVPTWLATISAVIGLFIIFSISSMPNPMRWLTTIGFIGLIIASVSDYAGKFKPNSALLVLGAASYSVYLIHNPAISLFSRMYHLITIELNINVIYLFVSFGALACGLFYYYFYEANALKYVRSVIYRKNRNENIELAQQAVCIAANNEIQTIKKDLN